MTRAARDLLEEALSLSEEDRLDIASELLASVDGDPDPDWDASWLAEIRTRERRASERGTPLARWEEVRARVLKRIGAM